MNYKTMTLEELKPGLKLICFNRPEVYNAISTGLVDDFLRILNVLHRDRSCRVVILSGKGEAFCSGTDLIEMTEFNKQPNKLEEMWHLQKKVSDIVQGIRAIPQPAICAINGVAAGGGASYALACDVRVASTDAKLVLSYINVGMTAADMGASYFLPRLIGMARASEIMLTGRQVFAGEGERIGLFAKVVEPDQLIPAAVEYADIMLRKADFGLRLTKESINLGMDAGSLSNQVLTENRNQFVCSAIGSFDRGAKRFKDEKDARRGC